MSLAKRRELEDLKTANLKLQSEVSSTYNRVRNDSIKAIKKDFKDFFESHAFAVSTTPPNSSVNEAKEVRASYGSMSAVLTQDIEDAFQFTLVSNIKDRGAEYNIGVYIDDPSSTPIRFQRMTTRLVEPMTELQELEASIDGAHKASEKLRKTIEGLGQIKAWFDVTSTNQQLPDDIAKDNFTEILNALFN